MPVSMGREGCLYEIKRISGNSELRAHLGSIGFHVGAVITLITNRNGNVIVHVKESRIAISREQARHIFI